MKSGSRLERILTEKKFAVTGELGPPRGADVKVSRSYRDVVARFVH